MFIIDCTTCEEQHLVSNAHILSTHRTSEGMIAYVRCAAGHTVIHKFPEAYPNPKPAWLMRERQNGLLIEDAPSRNEPEFRKGRTRRSGRVRAAG